MALGYISHGGLMVKYLTVKFLGSNKNEHDPDPNTVNFYMWIEISKPDCKRNLMKMSGKLFYLYYVVYYTEFVMNCEWSFYLWRKIRFVFQISLRKMKLVSIKIHVCHSSSNYMQAKIKQTKTLITIPKFQFSLLHGPIWQLSTNQTKCNEVK